MAHLLLAEAAGSFVSKALFSLHTLLSPLGRVKALMQLQGVSLEVRSGKAQRYRGIFDCFARVFQERGLAAFWYGHGALIACNLPKILFKKNDAILAINKWFKPETPGARLLVKVVAPHAARLCNAAINFPFQTLYLRRVASLPCSAPTSLRDDVAGALSSRSNFLSLYSGALASTSVEVLHNYVWFSTMIAFREGRPWKNDTGRQGKMSALLATNLAITTASFVTYPFENAIRRLQVDSQHPKEQRCYRGLFHCLRTVATEEGIARLWDGFGMGMVQQICEVLTVGAVSVVKARFGFASKAKPKTPTAISEQLGNYFNKLDLDHDGFLSEEELRGITRRTATSPNGRIATADEAAMVLKVWDKDGDGRVSLDDFQGAMKNAFKK